MWPFNKNKQKEEYERRAKQAEQIQQEWDKMQRNLAQCQADIHVLQNEVQALRRELQRSGVTNATQVNTHVLGFFEKFVPKSDPRQYKRKKAQWQHKKAPDKRPLDQAIGQMDKLFQ